jgi:hypothetical protein
VVTLYQLHRRLDAANLDSHPIQKELVSVWHPVLGTSFALVLAEPGTSSVSQAANAIPLSARSVVL